MNLVTAIEDRCEETPNWDNVFATIVVTNRISTDPGEIRGLVTLCIGTDEMRATYFADICKEVREFENLAEYQINENLSVKAGLRQFIDKWPDSVTLIGTNADGWLKPLLTAANTEYELFGERKVDFIDLGRFASVEKSSQAVPGAGLMQVLPQNKFRGRAGSLNKLAGAVDVHQDTFGDAVSAERRARTIAAVLRKHLERELEDY